MRLPISPLRWKPLFYLKWEERRLMKKRRLLEEKLRKKYPRAGLDIDSMQTTENYLETFRKAKMEGRLTGKKAKKSIKAGEKFVRTIQRHLEKREKIISRLEDIRAEIGKRQRKT